MALTRECATAASRARRRQRPRAAARAPAPPPAPFGAAPRGEWRSASRLAQRHDRGRSRCARVGVGANPGRRAGAGLSRHRSRCGAAARRRSVVACSSLYRRGAGGCAGARLRQRGGRAAAPRCRRRHVAACAARDRGAARPRALDANAPRTLDLDLLLYGEQRSDDRGAGPCRIRGCIERAFVLSRCWRVAPQPRRRTAWARCRRGCSAPSTATSARLPDARRS